MVKAQEFNSMDSKRLQTPKLYVYLDRSSICMHCPGHELSPKTKENYMKPYAFSEIFTK